MPQRTASQRITGLDAARGLAILGMIATHIYPLLRQEADGVVSPTWVGWTFTGVSSALFVVLAGVGLSLLTRNTAQLAASRTTVALRAVVLIAVGLLLGHAGSNAAIILVHYGVMFLMAMWCIALSRRSLTILAVSWIVIAPWLHGVLTRFMQLQAGGTATYVDGWRLWTSPTLIDVFTRPGVLIWDIFFTGYYPVISFFGYVLVGMAIGRMNLAKWSTGATLFLTGAALYVGARGLGRWLLTDEAFAYRVAHVTGVDVEVLSARAAVGAQLPTELLMGAPQWYGLAVPHSGAPLDIYSTAGAAMAVIGFFLLATRSRLRSWFFYPLTVTGKIAFTAYTAHIVLTGLWPRSWPAVLETGDPLWSTTVLMLLVHWVMVIGLGVVVQLVGTRGPMEALLRRVSNVRGRV